MNRKLFLVLLLLSAPASIYPYSLHNARRDMYLTSQIATIIASTGLTLCTGLTIATIKEATQADWQTVMKDSWARRLVVLGILFPCLAGWSVKNIIDFLATN